jgi:hypothetical protein
VDPRKKHILIAISIPLITVGIDGTILNVALPTAARLIPKRAELDPEQRAAVGGV